MNQPALALSAEMVNVLRPLTDRPLGDFAAELMVLELCRQRQISSGKAAELLEMERIEFIRFAGRQGIAFFDMSEDEFTREIENVDRFLRTTSLPSSKSARRRKNAGLCPESGVSYPPGKR